MGNGHHLAAGEEMRQMLVSAAGNECGGSPSLALGVLVKE